MLIQRDIQKELRKLSQQYPVVTITGPRQAGKTTLAKMEFPNYQYCNLENPDIRRLAEEDPNAFFQEFKSPLIIDEIQRVPHLLSYIQTIVDENEKKGMFILTGSHQLSLHQSITQSLAGRTALLNLLPFSIRELEKAGIKQNRDLYIYRGFLPRIYKDNLESTKAYRNYFQTYVERDLRQMINLKNLNLFQNFLKLLAGRIGQIVNLHSLSNDLGVSSTTLREWLSILEASFIIFRLHPYFENFGKRIIKSPKFYFTEIGLATYLLGIEELKQVSRDPLIGSLFENLVVLEAVKARANMGLDPNLYFYRDHNQNEVDLLYKKSRELIPIEIKSSMTLNSEFYKGINYFRKIASATERSKGYVIYAGELTPEERSIKVLHFTQTYHIFN
jgi:predicted AAA+ superfamily ATPase